MEDKKILEHYLKEVRKNKILPIEELNELFVKYKNGDNNAKKLLVNSNLRLVIKMALKYNPPLLQDAIQAGNIGLINSLETYNPTRDKRASIVSWMKIYIKKEMLDFFTTKSRLIRAPKNRINKNKDIDNESTDINDFDIREYNNPSRKIPASIDYVINESGDMIKDIIKDTSTEDYDNYNEVLLEYLTHYFYELDIKYQDTIKYRYFEEKTYRDIAKIMNVSVETVRHREFSAIKQLKVLMNKNKI